MAARRHLLLLLLSLAGGGCAAAPPNPSFPATPEEAGRALAEMAAGRKPLARPLVVLGGYLDPGLGPWWVARRLRGVIGDDRVLEVEFFFACTFDGCRAKLIEAVDTAFPCADPEATTEVDVVALSMGGLVARLAALPPAETASSRRRLRIARLFTISSPHRGAALAELPSLHPLRLDMRAGSDFLRRLNQAARDYALFPYVRLGDLIVGAENAAPPAEVPWWVPNVPFTPAHLASPTDARILADIARRLRGEEGLARKPAAGFPGEESER